MTIHEAVSAGDAVRTKQLLDEDPCLASLKNEAGDAPLHIACQEGAMACEQGALACVRLLLDNGADPNALSARGALPLGRAIRLHEEDIARELLDRGADPNVGERDTPVLHCANTEPLIRLLLQHGAKINARAANGETALDELMFRRPEQPIINLLLAQGGEFTICHFLRTPSSGFEEKDDARDIRTMKEAQPIMQSGGDRAKRLRLARKFWKKHLDFAAACCWVAILEKEYQQKKEALRRGLVCCKSKIPVLDKLGDVEFAKGNLKDAVCAWMHSCSLQTRNRKYIEFSSFIYLACVAATLNLPQDSQILLSESKTSFRLDDRNRLRIAELVKQERNTDLVSRAIQRFTEELRLVSWGRSLPGF